MHFHIVVDGLYVYYGIYRDGDLLVVGVEHKLLVVRLCNIKQVVHLLPLLCLLNGSAEALVEVGFVQKINGIYVKTLQGIVGVGCGKDERGVCRKLLCQLYSGVAGHLYIHKDYIGRNLLNSVHPLLRGGEGLQLNLSVLLAVALNYIQSNWFVIYCYTF